MDTAILGTKGEMVCRPTTWKDVLKFFFFNYGLHVLTVMSPPGSKTMPTVLQSILALLFPFSGTFRALKVIQQFARGESGDLQVALQAGALCMFVPSRGLPQSTELVYRKDTLVNGQHPVFPEPSTWFRFRTAAINEFFYRRTEVTLDSEYSLIVVPKSFTVTPPSDAGFTPATLSCNYSLAKAILGIIQVVYAITELYQSSLRQLPKFGYAAYSLTVIPYLIMSIVNLVAAACVPQYPAMFLVRYGGTSSTQQGVSSGAGAAHGSETALEHDRSEELVRGAVGEAYGSLSEDLIDIQIGNPRRVYIFIIGAALLVVAPYLVIYLLTSFNGRESTDTQRGFTMAWLVIGEVFGWTCFLARGRLLVFKGVLFSIVAIGGFVVVGLMMMGDETCIII